MEKFSHREIEVYTVWVDRIQMSGEIYNLQEARDVFDDWIRLGYTDVDLMCEYRFEEQNYEQTYANFKPYGYSFRC